MATLLCKCGEGMHTTDCPSPYIVDIYYKAEADKAINDDPNITLHNFLIDWDEKNNCQRRFMKRTEPVDYWFCPVCKRVYEVQNIPHGRWLRIYKKTNIPVSESFDGWKQIYVMPDADTDAAMEEEWEIHLSDYLKQHDSVLYYLSPDETIIHAVEKSSSKVLYSYELEDSWSSISDD